MPIYEYKGLNSKGKPVQGIRDADNPRVLKTLLTKEGIFLTQYAETTKTGDKKAVVKGAGVRAKGSKEIDFASRLQRIKPLEVAEMTRQFSTLLGAGVPVVDALSALIEQVENAKLKRVMTAVRQSVNEGAALHAALADHHKVFPTLYVNMVRAGESSGTLEIVFARLADFTESQVRLRGKVVAAMTYPAVMVLVAIGIIILLMLLVVPQLTQIFADLGTDLPFLTQALIAVSGFVGSIWFVLFLAFVVVPAIYSFLRWKRSPKGRRVWDRFVLRAPIVGPLARMLAIARFSKTLSTLLSSGVPMLAAMDIVRSVVNNEIMAEAVDNARESVREGQSLAEPLKRSKQFPPMVTHMIAIGEKSGHLEEMLGNVSRSYETQVETKVGMLTSILEPVMIVMMGGMVALLIFAVLMPMLQMNEAIQSGVQ